MPCILSRILTFLLVLGLIADPSGAAAFAELDRSSPQRRVVFSQEAFIPALLFYTHSFQQRLGAAQKNAAAELATQGTPSPMTSLWVFGLGAGGVLTALMIHAYSVHWKAEEEIAMEIRMEAEKVPKRFKKEIRKARVTLVEMAAHRGRLIGLKLGSPFQGSDALDAVVAETDRNLTALQEAWSHQVETAVQKALATLAAVPWWPGWRGLLNPSDAVRSMRPQVLPELDRQLNGEEPFYEGEISKEMTEAGRRMDAVFEESRDYGKKLHLPPGVADTRFETVHHLGRALLPHQRGDTLAALLMRGDRQVRRKVIETLVKQLKHRVGSWRLHALGVCLRLANIVEFQEFLPGTVPGIIENIRFDSQRESPFRVRALAQQVVTAYADHKISPPLLVNALEPSHKNVRQIPFELGSQALHTIGALLRLPNVPERYYAAASRLIGERTRDPEITWEPLLPILESLVGRIRSQKRWGQALPSYTSMLRRLLLEGYAYAGPEAEQIYSLLQEVGSIPGAALLNSRTLRSVTALRRSRVLNEGIPVPQTTGSVKVTYLGWFPELLTPGASSERPEGERLSFKRASATKTRRPGGFPTRFVREDGRLPDDYEDVWVLERLENLPHVLIPYRAFDGDQFIQEKSPWIDLGTTQADAGERLFASIGSGRYDGLYAHSGTGWCVSISGYKEMPLQERLQREADVMEALIRSAAGPQKGVMEAVGLLRWLHPQDRLPLAERVIERLGPELKEPLPDLFLQAVHASFAVTEQEISVRDLAELAMLPHRIAHRSALQSLSRYAEIPGPEVHQPAEELEEEFAAALAELEASEHRDLDMSWLIASVEGALRPFAQGSTEAIKTQWVYQRRLRIVPAIEQASGLLMNLFFPRLGVFSALAPAVVFAQRHTRRSFGFRVFAGLWGYGSLLAVHAAAPLHVSPLPGWVFQAATALVLTWIQIQLSIFLSSHPSIYPRLETAA